MHTAPNSALRTASCGAPVRATDAAEVHEPGIGRAAQLELHAAAPRAAQYRRLDADIRRPSALASVRTQAAGLARGTTRPNRLLSRPDNVRNDCTGTLGSPGTKNAELQKSTSSTLPSLLPLPASAALTCGGADLRLRSLATDAGASAGLAGARYATSRARRKPPPAGCQRGVPPEGAVEVSIRPE